MSNDGSEEIQLRDLPHDRRNANPALSAQTSNNRLQGPPFGSGSTSATAGRGGAHPGESPPFATHRTFCQYLQENLKDRLRDKGIDPLTRYQCDTDRYRIPFTTSLPGDRRNHECINFKNVDIFEEARGYYKEGGNAKAVNTLAVILLLIPLFPLSLLTLLLWTFPVLVIVSHLGRLL